MKTRNIFALLAALTLATGFTGCKSEEELDAKPAKEILRVLGGEIEIRSNDESTVVSVLADCHWRVENVETEEDGEGGFGRNLTIQPREGQGDGTLVISTDQNTTIADRTATFTLVSDGGLHQQVTIRQTGGGDGLNVNRSSFSFEAENPSTQLLTVTSNRPWNITVPSNTSWLHLSSTSGQTGATTVEISVDQSYSDATRSAQLTITYGSNTAEVVVTQAGIDFSDIKLTTSVPDGIITFPASGGEETILVESNAQWAAYKPTTATWMNINVADTVTTTGPIRIRVDQNTSGRDRLTAIVILAGSKTPKQEVVLVQQLTGSVASDDVTIGDLTSLYVSNEDAEFRYSYVADNDVNSYGLVYSTATQAPSVNDEVSRTVTIGTGGIARSVLGTIDGLDASTTYYVRA